MQLRLLGTSALALVVRTDALLLETTGRRTGRRRRTGVSYWEEGGAYYVGGGAGGMTRVDWVANLRAHPEATVWVRRRRLAVVAEELHGPEYERARARAFEIWPKAARYERSGRPIPYFRLTPAP